jgi:hypothetical protein
MIDNELVVLLYSDSLIITNHPVFMLSFGQRLLDKDTI